MQFTRNSKITTLLELHFCKKDPGKIFTFAMSPLGRGQRTVRRNWASSPALAAGEGEWEGPWATGERFGCLDGVEAARAAGCAGSQERWPPWAVLRRNRAAPGLGRERGKEGGRRGTRESGEAGSYTRACARRTAAVGLPVIGTCRPWYGVAGKTRRGTDS
jgi:hypothetical protein